MQTYYEKVLNRMRRPVLLVAVAIVALLSASGVAVAVTAFTPNAEEGFSPGGLTDRAVPSQGVPLLDSFFFEYTKCQSFTASCFGEVDHHITQILIAPNVPTAGNMQLGYHDVNSDDDYYFNVRHYLLTDPRIRRFDTGLDVGVGTAVKPLTRPTGDFVFVLLGFQLAFRGEDHHINKVGILEDNGNVTVTFADKNFDDTFLYRLRYAYVPRDLFREVGGLGSLSGTYSAGESGGADSGSISPGTSVIRGFRFDFEPRSTEPPTPPSNVDDQTDHHIRQIGVLTRDSDGKVEAAYADKNLDDRFGWLVRWGILK